MKQILSGLTVIDFTRALAGPFCTMILGDLGADIIKVETQREGDMSRKWGKFVNGISTYYLSVNRNKRSIALNLRNQESRPILTSLLDRADVVIENYRPDRMRALRLDYNAIKALYPKLIYASITGYGSNTSLKDWPGFDQIAQGYSGFMSITGTEESGPLRAGVPIADLLTGLWTALGIVSAYCARLQTGVGRHIETNLITSLFSFLNLPAQQYLCLGEAPRKAGNAHPLIAPYGVFDARDGALIIAPATEKMWQQLCALLGCHELLKDEKFNSNINRIKNKNTLTAILNGRLKTKNSQEWIEIFNSNGVPAGKINDIPTLLNGTNDIINDIIVNGFSQKLGKQKFVGIPIRMTEPVADTIGENDTDIRRMPPDLGQHTIEILRECGWQDVDIEKWRKGGVI